MKYWIDTLLLSIGQLFIRCSIRIRIGKIILFLFLIGTSWLAGYKWRDLDLLQLLIRVDMLSNTRSELHKKVLSQHIQLQDWTNAINSVDWYRYLAIKHGRVVPPEGTDMIHLKTLTEEAERYHIPLSIIYRLVWKESKYNPNAVSNKGARGMLQMIPSTFNAFKEKGKITETDPVLCNIKVGCYMLANLYKKYSRWDLALAAYNAGNVVDQCRCIPNITETQNYVKWILNK